jgi:imidazolonepropionase-like amidohydrolase
VIEVARRVIICLLALLLLIVGTAGAESPRVHALIDVNVVTRPGEVVSGATVVLRDGRIEAVGPADRVEVPADAVRHRGEEWWVYAGFVESWREYGLPKVELPERDGPESDPGLPGPGSDHVRLHPERRVVDRLVLSETEREALRAGGFTVAALIPDTGVLRGTAALVHLGEVPPERAVLNPELGVVADLTPAGGMGPDRYPSSAMGAVAAVRQSLLDAAFHSAQEEAERAYDPVAESLQPVLAGVAPLIFDPGALVLEPRVSEICAESDARGILLATGGEWRHPELVPRDVGLILPLDFTARPEIEDEEDWVQVSLDELRAWDLDPLNPALLSGRGHEFALSSVGLDRPSELLARLRDARDRGLEEDVAVAALTTVPARLWNLRDFGRVERDARAYLTVLTGGSLFDDAAEVEMVFIDGQPLSVRDPRSEAKASKERDPWTRTARSPSEDRGPFAEPEILLVRGATIWTMGPDGVLENSDLLVRRGRIERVGSGLEAPDGAMVIDAEGLHLTPGLIDAHSHIAMVGGTNEWTVASSAMVRVRDIINSEDRRIYQHLAGGLTVSHVLHGSANPIGGQCQAIKLRWGAGPDGLRFEEARPTIKFALGENPKRGNSHDGDWHHRYPQSRMGVDDFIRERFAAALDYRDALGRGEVGRDLELDALLEILDDERDIHCHSYRQDEILSLMRLMEEFDSRVAVFTHILEGYKVADEMARHGAAGSSFADWWAYKFEVYDAIPYNTTIMHDRGVSVSVNSDSPDLGRRLNTEAAKSVRYGGTPVETALRFVTINAAEQIGADHVVGSIEPGKHADFVLWDAPPLSTRATARQTWIEGKLYWDADRDADRTAAMRQEREALVARARATDGAEDPGGAGGDAPERAGHTWQAPAEYLWSRIDAGCNHLASGEEH